MTRSREVYLLDPQQHSPETIAVAFAKTSRSPESFRQITSELSNEKSAQFHEKWVVGYGHSSVAEHAVLHIAIENISRLAVECLESNRLASYTEKSTRYQQWGGADYFVPDEFSKPKIRELYKSTCNHLFALYEKSLPLVSAHLAKEYQSEKDENEATKERKIRTAAIDVCRFLLPVSAFANVGVTINARALEHAITKMLTHPLMEVQSLGNEIKTVSQNNIPTLLKYANKQESINAFQETFSNIVSFDKIPETRFYKPGSQLVYFDPNMEENILLSSISKSGSFTYAQSRAILSNFDKSQRFELLDSFFNTLKDHDIPARELEYGNFLFEVILDQGAYLELKRHRMMTQTPLPFSPKFSYAIPQLIVNSGLMDEFQSSMQFVQKTYNELAEVSTSAAAYILPNAFNRCVLIQCNFRSLYHLLSLRTAPNAHFSMRRIAHQMADNVRIAMPNLGNYIKTFPHETASDIENKHFYQV